MLRKCQMKQSRTSETEVKVLGPLSRGVIYPATQNNLIEFYRRRIVPQHIMKTVLQTLLQPGMKPFPVTQVECKAGVELDCKLVLRHIEKLRPIQAWNTYQKGGSAYMQELELIPGCLLNNIIADVQCPINRVARTTRHKSPATTLHRYRTAKICDILA